VCVCAYVCHLSTVFRDYLPRLNTMPLSEPNSKRLLGNNLRLFI